MWQMARPGEPPVMLTGVDVLGQRAEAGPQATGQIQPLGWCASDRAQVHARVREQPTARGRPSRSVIARHWVRADEPLPEPEQMGNLDDPGLGAPDVGDEPGAAGERSGTTKD